VEATFTDGVSHGSEQLLTTLRGTRAGHGPHHPLRDDSGAVVAVMEMHTDIGAVKKLQADLARSQDRLAQLFEEVPCFITVQGADRRIQHANRKFRETFGLDAIGKPCFGMYKHARSSAWSAHRRRPSPPGDRSITRRFWSPPVARS